MRRLACILAFLFTASLSIAQTVEDYAVELSATVTEMPPSITLHWKRITYDTLSYHIWRKSINDTSWGTEIAILPSSASSYTDHSVIIDSAYEYQVFAKASYVTSTGYIYAGVRKPPIHNRGTILLLVDTTYRSSCADGIDSMMCDFRADGWQVVRHDLSPSLRDVAVKAIIANDYATRPDVKAAMILGHIAVPYSGDYAPDNHPEHKGAQPADVYYSCLTGTFTDGTINDISGGYTDNHNVPGDGKWDQTYISTPSLIQIGRVDYYNEPSFHATAVQMMRRYLDRLHSFKTGQVTMRRRGELSDNFGVYAGEAFAANGWRNIPPMVTRDSMYTFSFIPTLSGGSYLWAYGCGGGSFNSSYGIGTTFDFASAGQVNSAFVMLWGSYFGDWNSLDNFLRAPLCANVPALATCWAGRPNWFMHHMALGENIGYSTVLTQNNRSAIYKPANQHAGGVHIALMGDPTLRNDYILRATNLTVTTAAHSGATLNWSASPDAGVIGYYVYRADSAFGYYQQISPMITATTFYDFAGTDGRKYYMVRPVKLQSTPSGNYYNIGLGTTDSAIVSYGGMLNVTTTATVPVVSIFPNPASDVLKVTVSAPAAGSATVIVINSAGMQMSATVKQLKEGDNNFDIKVADLAPGNYTLLIKSAGNTAVQKWVKL